MIDNNNHIDPAFAFMKLKKEVQGVKHAFIFPRQKPQNPFEKNMNQFISGLSRVSPTKIYLRMVKGGVITCITNQFVIGCVINCDANPTLVEMILDRIVLNLDTTFEALKIDTELIKAKIKERIEGLTNTPVMVSLEVTPLSVEGYITVTANPKQKEHIQSEIRRILSEEIPFFCSQNITLNINTSDFSATMVWVPGSTF